MRVSLVFRILISILLMLMIILTNGCSKEQPQFETRHELENSFTTAFQSYGVYGATIEDDAYLMQVWVKGDFLAVYQENEEEIKKLFSTWLDHLYRFKGTDKAVGVLVKKGKTDLFHASRDRQGRYSFRPFGQ